MTLAGIIMTGTGWYQYRQTTYFVRHSPSALFLQLDENPSTHAKGSIPADQIAVNPENKKKLASLFEPLYVVKDPRTDCSFTAAFMLMVLRDPNYPYRILSEKPGAGYEVGFPGLNYGIKVTPAEIDDHFHAIEKNRSLMRRFSKGYSPAGIEIIRSAYYKYQRLAGLRREESLVYGGGWPDKDLIILSGVGKGLRIEAAKCEGIISNDDRSFEACDPVLIETRPGSRGFKDRVLSTGLVFENVATKYLNPDEYFVIVASNKKRNGLFGPRIVRNHAYYLLDINDDHSLILGNPYQTRRPVVITLSEFKKRFMTVYLINKHS